MAALSFRLLIGLLCLLMSIRHTSAQERDLSPAVDKLFAPWARDVSPGCALAVIRDGEIVHQRGYGMADLENSIPIRSETVFNIASVSKQFTVFLILLLVHAGLLSLDDDVRRHVPDLPDFGKVITVRHLIHHTSGLREDWSMLTLSGWRTEDVITRDDVFRLIRRQKTLNFRPGDDYSYCNTGYHLLAQIVQKISGQSLRQYGETQIFRPLGMTQTVFQDDYRQTIKGRSSSYAQKKGGGFERFLYGAGRAGPGNLHTSILDLAKWDQNFYTPKVGNAKVLDDLQRKARLNGGKEIDYAGGLRLGVYRGLPTVEHSGVAAGYRSVLLRFPEQKFSVIILANVSSFKPAIMARQVADLYLKEQLQPRPPANMPLPEEILKDFAGEYRFASGLLLSFVADGYAFFQENDAVRLPLTRMGKSEFVERESGAHFVFSKPDGAPMALCYIGVGLDQSGGKVERPKLSADQLGEFTGTFFSPELDTLYAARVRDGKLVLRHRKGEFELRPLAADEFSTPPGSLFATLRYVRNDRGEIVGFTVSTPRAWHIRFAKAAILETP